MKIFNDFCNLQKFTRTIIASAPDFSDIINDLKKLDCKYVICGGLALSAYSIVRNTDDIDILVKSEENIEDVKSQLGSDYKQVRPHAFMHKKTGIEIEVLTPEFIKYPYAENFVDRSNYVGNIKIVSLPDLISMKLKAFRNQDKADIESIIKKNNINTLRGSIDPDMVGRLDTIINETKPIDLKEMDV